MNRFDIILGKEPKEDPSKVEWGRHLKKENKRLAHRKERTVAKRIVKKEAKENQ